MRWKVKPNSSHVGLNFLMALIYLDDFGVFSISNMHPLLVFFWREITSCTLAMLISRSELENTSYHHEIPQDLVSLLCNNHVSVAAFQALIFY